MPSTELEVRLKALAEATGRSEHVNEAVLGHLAEHEAQRIAGRDDLRSLGAAPKGNIR